MLDFGSVTVRIRYANMAQANKVRAWARRNGAVVKLSRYAKDAYEGEVKILSPWNVGQGQTLSKAGDLRARLAEWGAHT